MRREQNPLDDYERVVVKFRRTAKVVKGGKRFTISALVVIGDKRGKVGWGYGKAKEMMFAVEKGVKDAAKRMITVPVKGTTIPHSIERKSCATRVLMRPACPGTGIKAGLSARPMLELAGIRDVLTKVFGSTNPLNVVKATYECLQDLRTKEQIERTRGILRPKKEEAEAAPATP